MTGASGVEHMGVRSTRRAGVGQRRRGRRIGGVDSSGVGMTRQRSVTPSCGDDLSSVGSLELDKVGAAEWSEVRPARELELSSDEELEFRETARRVLRPKSAEELRMKPLSKARQDHKESRGKGSSGNASYPGLSLERIFENSARYETEVMVSAKHTETVAKPRIRVTTPYRETKPVSSCFVAHKDKKGWLVCRCGASVWPPNCRKHLQSCSYQNPPVTQAVATQSL